MTTVATLLEKLASTDKDLRHMATSDLIAGLDKNASFVVEPRYQDQLVGRMLEGLRDPSPAVASLSVKALPLLMTRLPDRSLYGKVVKSVLAEVLSTKKENHRDTAALCLKEMLTAPGSPELSTEVASLALPSLVEGAAGAGDFEVSNECLSLLLALATSRPQLLAHRHSALLPALFQVIQGPRAALRKRAAQVAAALAPALDDAVASQALDRLLSLLSSAKPGSDTTAAPCQALGLIAASMPGRFAPFVAKAVQAAAVHARGCGEEDVNAREHALQLMEACVPLCAPGEPAAATAVDVALEFLGFDPNYEESDEDEGEGEGEGGEDGDASMGSGDEGDEDGEGDEEEEEGLTDDEDESWRVRRACCKILAALTHAPPHVATPLLPRVLPPLLKRASDRDTSVRLDALASITALLTHAARQREGGAGQWMRSGGGGRAKASASAGAHANASASAEEGSAEGAASAIARQAMPRLASLLKGGGGARGAKLRSAAFSAIAALCSAAPGALGQRGGARVAGQAAAAIAEARAEGGVREAAMGAVRAAVEAGGAGSGRVVAEALPALAGAARAGAFRVSAEAMELIAVIARSVRPSSDAAVASGLSQAMEAVAHVTGVQDADQDTKNAATRAAAALLATSGHAMPATAAAAAVANVADRLSSETTRLPALRAIEEVARAAGATGVGVGDVARRVVGEATQFLKLAHRPTRIAALGVVTALATEGEVRQSELSSALSLLPLLIADDDVPAASAALDLAAAAIARFPTLAKTANDGVGQAAARLARSPLVQGPAIASLERFYAACVKAGILTPDTATRALMALADTPPPLSAPAQTAVARCIAAASAAAGPDALASTATHILALLSDASTPEPRLCLALAVSGALATQPGSALPPALPDAVRAALGSGGEAARAAASLALGRLAASDPDSGLRRLLADLTGAGDSARGQYLVLCAVMECLKLLRAENATAGAGSPIPASLLEAVLGGAVHALGSQSADAEEGVKAAVRDTLGLAGLMAPAATVAFLQKTVREAAAGRRWAAVGAVREMAVGGGGEEVVACVGDFLQCLGDEDREVQRASLKLLAGLAAHRPAAVAPLVPQLLPRVYALCPVDPANIEQVPLGAFKITVDRGQAVRVAAMEALEAVVDRVSLTPGEATELLRATGAGLAWNRDIGAGQFEVLSLAHGVVVRAAGKYPRVVVPMLDALAPPLTDILKAEAGKTAVQQEQDRFAEVHRSALRAVFAMSQLPSAELSQELNNCIQTIQKMPGHLAVLEQLQKEHLSSGPDARQTA